MARGQVLQFPGATIEKYDAVQKELGWNGENGKPDGLLAHAAGSTDGGFCVVEWWQSEADWDKFFAEKASSRVRDRRWHSAAADKPLRGAQQLRSVLDHVAVDAVIGRTTTRPMTSDPAPACLRASVVSGLDRAS